MDKLKVVMIDDDEEYLMKLVLKFFEEEGDEVDLSIVTCREYMNEYFKLPKQIDILIIDGELYSDEFQKHKINNIFILTEEANRDGCILNYNTFFIYKYSWVKEIYNEIIKKNIREERSRIVESKIIGVYSPSGGVGKTTVAMGIASALGTKHNKRVLYINTESIQAFNFMLQNTKYCESDFHTSMIERDENILEKLDGSLGYESFDYILPFRQVLASLNIGFEEYKFLIDKIKKEKVYDYIIIDTSSEFTSDKSKFLGNCNKVILVTTQSKCDVAKMDAFSYNVDFSNQNKFIFVCNKYKKFEENYLIKDECSQNYHIKEYIDYMNDELLNVETLIKEKILFKLSFIVS